MKRLTILAVFAVAFAGLVAAPAGAGEPTPRIGKASRTGRAPTVQEAMRSYKHQPPAFGAEREQPRPQFPEFLRDKAPVVTERSKTMQGFTQGLSPTVENSFGGYDSNDNFELFGFRVMPPDVEGDVGREHYVQWNNLGWKYWDKETKTPNGPFPGNSFWAGSGGSCETENNGDPVVLYDHFAGRWVFTQFDIGPGLACFAISAGEDPSGPYTTYEFPISLAGFNDYPKMGVFLNADGSESGYHMTTNEFNGGFLGVNLTAFNRDMILAGDPGATFAQFTIPPAGPGERFAFSLQPPHLDGGSAPAPAGICGNYIMAFDEETWGDSTGVDGYRMWEFCVNKGGSPTLVEKPFLVASAPFDSELCGFGPCVPQPPPGPLLDTLAQFTMFRFSQYMIDGTLEGVISHTVDLGGDLAGVRWAEFDLSTPGKAILDEGVIDQGLGDGIHRWMPSIAQNKNGDLLAGYTAIGEPTASGLQPEGPDVPGSFRLGGRPFLGAPQGMDEQLCILGTGVQLGGSRWGDYSTVSVNPSDGCTFWATHEYVETTGSFQWDTQVCVANFANCQGQPCDVLTLTGPSKTTVGEDFFLEVCGTGPDALVRVAGGRDLTDSVRVVPGCGPVAFDIGPRPNNFGSVVADANGEATSTQNLGGEFGNKTIYFQVVDNSTCTVSNVLAVEVNKP